MGKLKPPQKPGTDMDTLDSHTLMEVTTILARDLPNHLPTTVTDMDVVMDMGVTDMVDTVESDPLNHTTDMVDTDHTEDTDMAVVMATDMAVNSYFQEAKRFYYLIFKIDVWSKSRKSVLFQPNTFVSISCHLLTLQQK